MTADTPAKEQEKFVLRLPDGMRDRLKAEAEANKRSMNAEIVARLEGSFEEVGGGRRFASLADRIAAAIKATLEGTSKKYEGAVAEIERRADKLEAEIEQTQSEIVRLKEEVRLKQGSSSSPTRAAEEHQAINRD